MFLCSVVICVDLLHSLNSFMRNVRMVKRFECILKNGKKILRKLLNENTRLMFRYKSITFNFWLNEDLVKNFNSAGMMHRSFQTEMLFMLIQE